MEKKIKISIVIAAYNGERYIAEQVKSLLEQTFLPDEIIICDDSKNDLTYQAVQAFMPNDIIRYIKNDKPLGGAETSKKRCHWPVANTFLCAIRTMCGCRIKSGL